MKAILFLLLPFFSLAQNGQTESEIELLKLIDMRDDSLHLVVTIPEGHEGLFYEPGVEWVDASQAKRGNTMSTDENIRMSDLLEYEKECTQDSVVLYLPVQCDNPYCLVDHGYEYKTIHTAPSFEGFIEWLKRKQ